MKDRMDHIHTQLGYDRVRQRIASYCSSDRASQEAAVLPSFIQPSLRDHSQSLLLEMRDLLLRESSPGFMEFEDPAEILQRLKVPGAVLSEPELYLLGLFLRESRRLAEFFRKRSESCPQITRWTELSLPDTGLLHRAVLEKFSEDARLMDTASRLLSDLRRRIRQLQMKVQERAASLAQKAVEDNISESAQVGFRNGRLVIPVRSSRKNAIPGIIHDQSQSGQTTFLEPMVIVEMNNELRQTELEEQEEVYRILKELCEHLRPHLRDIEQSVTAYHALDLLNAKARFSVEFTCEKPLRDTQELRIRNGRNVELQMKRETVPLNMHLPEGIKGVIITGPNAGGKTVTLKTVGLMVLMDQAGLLLPAEQVNLPEFRNLYVDIGDGQSIDGDLSTYSSHVQRLRMILDQADEFSIVLLDELGTGTDPDEGAALAEAILTELLQRGVTVIATTHHSALKSFAYDHPRLINGSMSFNDRTLAPGYEFRGNIPGSSYAIEIARRYQMPESVLQFATSRIGRGREKLEKLITDLQRKIHRYDSDLKDLRQKEQDLKSKIRLIEKQKKEIDAKYKKADREALARARTFLQNMNSEFEKTVRDLRSSNASTDMVKKGRQALAELQTEVELKSEKLDETPSEGLYLDKLKVGDTVYVKSLDQNGTIREINQRQKKIWVDIDGRRLRLDIHWLAPAVKRKQQVSTSVSGGRSAGYRLDLRGKRMEEALSETDAFLDSAVLSGLHSVEILHGKGDGILMKAVRDMLPADPRVKDFNTAPVEQGGAGITLVNLKS